MKLFSRLASRPRTSRSAIMGAGQQRKLGLHIYLGMRPRVDGLLGYLTVAIAFRCAAATRNPTAR